MKILSTMLYCLRGDEVLFLVRDKKNDKVHTKGAYVSIGGKLEAGESIEAAAIREVQEESGIVLSPDDIELRGILHYTSADGKEDDWVNFLYVTHKPVETPPPGNEGSFAWVKRADFDKVNMYAQDKIFFELLFKSRMFVVEFNYRGHEILGHKVLQVVP